MATVRPQAHAHSGGGHRPRILRIGVILGGKIIEERLVRNRSDVTIGQSSKNTFAVPIEQLPRQWPLFVEQNGVYYLRYSEKMDGRLSTGEGVHTLDALKGHGAQQQGDAWIIQLPESARGKISLGEMTILFQFVTAPPRQPRPQLPASVRGTFADRIDPQLAVILAISLLFHTGVWVWAVYFHDARDKFQGRTARVYEEEFAPNTVDVVEIPFDVPATPTDEGEEPAEEPKDAGKENKPPAGEPSQKPRGGGDDRPRGGGESSDPVRADEAVAAYVDSLFSDEEDAEGGIGGMNRRKPGTDLQSQIDHVKDSNARVEAGGGRSDTGPRQGRDAVAGTGKGPALGEPGGTTSSGPVGSDRVPQGRINLGESASLDETSLTPDLVLAKIRSAYMAGLQRCQKDLLKRDPSATGRVTLQFMVGESGRVTKAKVDGFDPAVSACIHSRVMGWRFGVPKDSDGDTTSATFRITLALQAG